MQPKVLFVLIALLSITAFSCASTGSQDTDSAMVSDPMTSSSTVDSDTAPLSIDNTVMTERDRASEFSPNYPATDMTPGIIDGTPTNNVYTTTGPGVSVSTGTTRANLTDDSTTIGSMTSSSSLAPDDEMADDTAGTEGTRRRMSKN